MSNYWGHKIHSSIFILNIIGIFCLTLYSYNFFLDQNFLIFKFILVITLSASLLLELILLFFKNNYILNSGFFLDIISIRIKNIVEKINIDFFEYRNFLRFFYVIITIITPIYVIIQEPYLIKDINISKLTFIIINILAIFGICFERYLLTFKFEKNQ